MITKNEKEDLLQACRLRARTVKAEFEQELDTTTNFEFAHRPDFNAAYEVVEVVTNRANEEIRTSLAGLGFPSDFLSWRAPGWREYLKEFEHSFLEYYLHLTWEASHRIEQMEQRAIDFIELASRETMPTVDELIPAVTVEEARQLLCPERSQPVPSECTEEDVPY